MHQGADAARCSDTSKGPVAPDSPTPRDGTPHDRGPKVPEALLAKGEGQGRFIHYWDGYRTCMQRYLNSTFGTVHSLLGTEQVTVSEFYLLGLGRDSLRRFVYLGMARRIITGMDRQSTSGNLTGGGGHRRAGMRWAWAVPWITPGCSISLPP
ncbi:hypothetical protein GOBAR_AA36886 [Gossypium barbadense]|uniref:Uncharacterized protein n=1 Tax=Gossypium barbadense TaxID=3634 RepID=A0A2P5VYD5_GOSBA|nr:hypothetical protein GOBAR_AA36886 [Gossypium barbadense]